MRKNKFVYLFNEGNSSMVNLLGGKGANLSEMTRLRLPVPKGFTVTTQACLEYQNTKTLSEKIKNQVLKALKKVEKASGKNFGKGENTLILAIRSGARISMPGMMDTILNLGLNDEVVEGFAKQHNPRFAYDCYRRFIQMYSNVVHNVKIEEFENEIEIIKKQNKIKLDSELTEENLKDLIKEYKKIFKSKTGKDFPQDVHIQLLEATQAVFRSWLNPRAILYRRLNNIPDEWGTAVNVQAMVFGNLDELSGTGVAFTRNPSTGENKLYGEYLMNAQGEDVVAGIRTPSPIESLREQNKAIYDEFVSYAKLLEDHYKDMQDMEFTIQSGKLYMLQTRNGKRTPTASLKIAVDLVNEGKIGEKTAVLRQEPNKLNSIMHPVLNINELKKLTPIATGLPASPGGACGKIAFSPEKAVEFKKQKEKSILVRFETSPEDIEGMTVSEGILTARGGMTSHAAVVARGMGKVCVVGCDELEFTQKGLKIGEYNFKEGDIISIDGITGNVYKEAVSSTPTDLTGDFAKIMEWAKKYQKTEVHANADTPKDAKSAYISGANGIGLCRTEHMFFESDRIQFIREMIIADNLTEREKALNKLLKFQKKDFLEIFKEMKGRPVTIRLLDPPLHEFLPKTDAEIKDFANSTNRKYDEIHELISKLKEVNPMLGHRGLRLAVTYPEIYKMQTRAIIEAGIEAEEKFSIKAVPEIMIPLTASVKEFLFVKDIVKSTADEILKTSKIKINYEIGTMIETPRACIMASELAKYADFFSFGTNDLTQLVFAFSRDDAEKFLNEYFSHNLLKTNPFEKLDIKGVGSLIENAIKDARKVKPKIKIGVCGEHAGEADSINFFVQAGVSYVSCSTFRLPIARLACAISDLKKASK